MSEREAMADETVPLGDGFFMKMWLSRQQKLGQSAQGLAGNMAHSKTAGITVLDAKFIF